MEDNDIDNELAVKILFFLLFPPLVPIPQLNLLLNRCRLALADYCDLSISLMSGEFWKVL